MSLSPLSCIGQIAISVKESPRAIDFYQNTPGLKFLFEAGQMAFFDCGGIRLTADITATTELLKGRGVQFESFHA